MGKWAAIWRRGKPIILQFAVFTKGKRPRFELHPVDFEPRSAGAHETHGGEDMAGHPVWAFYPRPSPMHCPTCPFRKPLARPGAAETLRCCLDQPIHRRRSCMSDLIDGESIKIQGSASRPYELKNVAGVYSCSCPACATSPWRSTAAPASIFGACVAIMPSKCVLAPLSPAVPPSRSAVKAPPALVGRVLGRADRSDRLAPE